MVNGHVVVTAGNGQKWVEATIGINLGNGTSRYCVIENSQAELILKGGVRVRKNAMRKTFETLPPARVALEVETHSR